MRTILTISLWDIKLNYAEELWIALSRLELPLPIYGATKSLCLLTPGS